MLDPLEILQRLHDLGENSNTTEQREAVEAWRVGKLKYMRSTSTKNLSNFGLSSEESRMLKRALEFNWQMLLEDIGLWIPPTIYHIEHDDKPENELEDEEIIPGLPLPPECNTELHTDYGGTAVRWGLTHHKENAADCCQACIDQAKRARPGALKCNIWVYCPSEYGCHSPDKYEHKHQECWLKQSCVNKGYMKDDYVRFFVRRPTRRAPIINRGYYARWSVLRKLLHQFLNAGKNNDNEKPKQILSLGAGFDTTFFQLQDDGMAPHLYVELDFKEGQYDVCCPMMSAWDLHKAWPEAEFKSSSSMVYDYLYLLSKL